MLARRSCSQLMPDGQLYRAGPGLDRPFFFAHDPARATEVAEARQLGGLRYLGSQAEWARQVELAKLLGVHVLGIPGSRASSPQRILQPMQLQKGTPLVEEDAGAQQVLVVGAGVIGSVYAGRLAEAGHRVTLVARGGRLAQLELSGLRLRRAGGLEVRPMVTVVDQIPRAAFDLVLVAVRREQAAAAAQQIAGSVPRSVLLFGNFAGMVKELGAVLGDDHTLLGFPGIGGRIEPDGLVTYLPIDQQPTVVGAIEPLQGEQAKVIVACLRSAGFDTLEQPNMARWLASHAALVVPMAAAIRAAGGQADTLADRSDLLHLAVRATSAIYRAQRRRGELVANRNLRLLYLVMPVWFATRYWSGALRGEFGELAFAAHTRHAWDEMALLASWLRSTIADDAAAVAALDRLMAYRSGP